MGNEDLKELGTVMASAWRIARETSESTYSWDRERDGKIEIYSKTGILWNRNIVNKT